jgi:hypothetical protein
MRSLWPLSLVALQIACGKPEPMPPKRPNTELIVGEFARKPPVGTTAARFRSDGSVVIAHEAGELDTKPLAAGNFKLDGDKLTLSYASGEMCPAGVEGTYTVVISKVGIHFAKVDDPCERRAKMDGETWYRIK